VRIWYGYCLPTTFITLIIEKTSLKHIFYPKKYIYGWVSAAVHLILEKCDLSTKNDVPKTLSSIYVNTYTSLKLGTLPT